MNILLVCLMGVASVGVNDKPYFPYQPDVRWTYQNDAGATLTHFAGSEVEAKIGGKDVKAIRISWWDGADALLVSTKDGVRIYRERILGPGGFKANVVWVDLRWGKEKSWTVLRRSGCRGWRIKFEQKGFEQIETFRGSISAMKIRAGNEIFWLAPGIGIVKYVKGDRTWTLKSFAAKRHIHKCGKSRQGCWLCGV